MHHGNVTFVERNCQHLKQLLDLVMTCAKRDISHRGRRETGDSKKKKRKVFGKIQLHFKLKLKK